MMEYEADDVHVTRFAIQYKPPTLIIEYAKGEKTFLKKIRIKKLDQMDADKLTKKLIKHNHELLNSDMVDQEQLRELVELLTMPPDEDDLEPEKPPATIRFGPGRYQAVSPSTSLQDLDLNKVSEEENQAAKARMSVEFEAKRLKPGDPGYIFDKQVEFGAPVGTSEWDEED